MIYFSRYFGGKEVLSSRRIYPSVVNSPCPVFMVFECLWAFANALKYMVEAMDITGGPEKAMLRSIKALQD